MHALPRFFASTNCQSEQSSKACTAVTGARAHSWAIVAISQSLAR
jgi:hypothetical protein